MKTLIATIAVLIGGSALASQTDYQCVNNCTASGSMYNFCVSKCQYPDAYRPVDRQIHTTDFACMNSCTSQGYMYSFCQSRCSN